jgi:hypothetical protein
MKTLKLRKFTYTSGFIYNHSLSGYDVNTKILGFIAQEVEPLFPESVVIEKDEIDKIDDLRLLNIDQLIKCLFGAFQKAQDKIESLSGRLYSLEQSS